MTLPKLPELLIIRRFDESRHLGIHAHGPWGSASTPLSRPGSACNCRLEDGGIIYEPCIASGMSSCIEVVAISCTSCGVQSALSESAAHGDRLSAEACVRELIQCRACSLAGSCSLERDVTLEAPDRRRRKKGVLHHSSGTREGLKPYRPCV